MPESKFSDKLMASPFDVNKKFLQNYHDNVLETNRSGKDGDKTVTMRIVGIGIEGKEYLLPSYDPDTQEIMNTDQIYDKFKADIDAGRVVGYPDWSLAEQDREKMYPEIIGNSLKRSFSSYIFDGT